MEPMPKDSSPNQVLARAEKTIEHACEGVEAIFILRVGDRITYRYTYTGKEFSGVVADVHIRNLLDTVFPAAQPQPSLDFP